MTRKYVRKTEYKMTGFIESINEDDIARLIKYSKNLMIELQLVPYWNRPKRNKIFNEHIRTNRLIKNNGYDVNKFV